MSAMSSFCFSLSNHLIPGFFGKRPTKKKKRDIISIQFVRSLCEGTDRLSYFGHTPRGELEAWQGGRFGGVARGGWINGHFYSHQIITGHSNRKRTNRKSPLETTLLKVGRVHSNSTESVMVPTVMKPSSRPESGLGGACSRSMDHFSMMDDT